jgi:hypothetical protein
VQKICFVFWSHVPSSFVTLCLPPSGFFRQQIYYLPFFSFFPCKTAEVFDDDGTQKLTSFALLASYSGSFRSACTTTWEKTLPICSICTIWASLAIRSRCLAGRRVGSHLCFDRMVVGMICGSVARLLVVGASRSEDVNAVSSGKICWRLRRRL